MTISGYVTPAGGAVIYYEIYEYGGWDSGAYQHVSSPGTYSHTFSYSSLKSGPVSAIRMVVGNSYGTNNGNGQNIILYTPPASSLNVTVYNSTGHVIAYYTIADVIMQTPYSNMQRYVPGGTDLPINFGIAIGWPSNTNTGGLWSVDQTIKNAQTYNTNSDNSFICTPLKFCLSEYSQVIYYNQSSTPQEICQDPGGSTYYSFPPLAQSNGSPAHLFGINSPVSIFSNELNEWIDIFPYTATLNIMTNSQTGVNDFGGPYAFTSRYTSATLYSGVVVTYTT